MVQGVYIRWTGLLDWTTGLDYWTRIIYTTSYTYIWREIHMGTHVQAHTHAMYACTRTHDFNSRFYGDLYAGDVLSAAMRYSSVPGSFSSVFRYATCYLTVPAANLKFPSAQRVMRRD